MKMTNKQITTQIARIQATGSGFPWGFIDWFGKLAANGKALGYFTYEGAHIFYAIQHLDAESWRDNYFMEGYSPRQAILEDMKRNIDW